jgi:hypothetical protein
MIVALEWRKVVFEAIFWRAFVAFEDLRSLEQNLVVFSALGGDLSLSGGLTWWALLVNKASKLTRC